MNTFNLYQGDALAVLETLPSESIQCCVTSPPYFGLRDYGIAGQIGLEASLDEYVQKLVAVFREVRRVLKNDGILWLNIGDSYATNTVAGNKVFGNPEFNKNRPSREQTKTPAKSVPKGLKVKDLLMVPARVALALQADGWWLRSDVIWYRTNGMPECVTDRPSCTYEHVFLLAKSKKYYFDYEPLMQPARSDHRQGGTQGYKRNERLTYKNADGSARGNAKGWEPTELVRGRNVWTFPSKPFKGAHFAVMPEELARRCITSGSKYSSGDIILDPFVGSGTVGMVAFKMGRSFIGIDLNPEYLKIAEARIAPALDKQLSIKEAINAAS